jgi:nucleoside-diphosphate-sugar epimerase
MRILIIGGTGLISTAITREFLQRGDQVVLYNRGKSAVRIPDGAQFLYGDRSDTTAFEQQIQDAGPFDCVIDMICYNADQAESTIRATRGQAGQVILTSTVDVYNKPALRYPIREDEPRRGNNAYGRHKVACENVFLEAYARGDCPATIIRPAMTYGEGRGIIDWQGWSTRIFDRLRKGKPIITQGDGSALWVACHVDDAARAYVHAATNPATIGKTYHITGEEWLTWNRYYQEAAAAIDAPEPHLVHIPTDVLVLFNPERAALCESNFQGNNIFDNTAAHTDLNFRYTIPWREGVARTYRWLRDHKAIDSSDDDPFDDQVVAAWRRMMDSLAAEFRS